MIKRIEDLNFYELLEVSPQASAQEIHRAYERIKRVYEPNSVALYSLFTPEETAVIYQRIEEAYRTLVYEDNRKKYDMKLQGIEEAPPPPQPAPQKFQPPQQLQPSLPLPSENRYLRDAAAQDRPPDAPPAQEPASTVSQFIAEFSGPAIRMLREQKGLSLRNVADMTKLGTRYLECIEEENFAKLPARAYIRGFLMLYAKALACDADRMAGDYLKRYDAAMKPAKK